MGTYSQLPNEQRSLITQMFFGPFKDEWKCPKGFVDNRDKTIAKRLNISFDVVRWELENQLNSHFEKIITLRNQEREYSTSNPMYEEQV